MSRGLNQSFPYSISKRTHQFKMNMGIKHLSYISINKYESTGMVWYGMVVLTAQGWYAENGL